MRAWITNLSQVVTVLVSGLALSLPMSAIAAMSCSVTTAAACTGSSAILLRMSGTSNAHSELPSQSNSAYANNVVCCSGVTGLGNSCSGTYAVVAKLSAVTNAHIEQNTNSNYANNACMSISSGTVTIGYQSTNCTGYDTTLASMSASTNAQSGDGSAYTTKICGTATAASQSLTFSISANSVGFGSLDSSAARYANSAGTGSATETEAHQLAVSTNASSGYTVTVRGATLTSGGNTITAIGGTNTASSAGAEQFGLRMTATGGVGTVTSPYSATGFAYAADANTVSQVASASSGDGVTTTYSVRYLSNISGATETGSYSANLVYVATANF